MKLTLKNINGKDVGDVLVPKSFLESKTSSSVVRQAVLAEMVNLRQGTHSAKNRSSVRGGGKKPWPPLRLEDGPLASACCPW